MKKPVLSSIVAVLAASALAAQAPPAPPAASDEYFEIAAPPPPPPSAGVAGVYIQAPAPPAPPAPPPPAVRAFALASGSGSYLGIGVAEVDNDRAKELKLREARGVEITRIEEDSPAQKAGIKEHDVVLEYNGQRVEGVEQFVRLVRETPAGRQVTLGVSRNGAPQTLTATLGQRKGGRYEFRMGPEFDQNMRKLQEELGRMRFNVRVPDIPEPFMAWRTGALGIEAETLTSQLAEFFGVKEGVLVRSVTRDSSADKAGIKAGDVITKVDNEAVRTPSQISSRIRSLESKKTFPITVVRSRQEMALNVTIEERKTPTEVRPRRIRTAPPNQFRPERFRGRTVSLPSDQL